MESDLLAWLIFAVSVAAVGLVAAAEVALTTASRSKIRKMSELGNRRAALVDSLLGDAVQFWLTSMAVKSLGLVVAGIAVAHVLARTASLGWLALAAAVAWLVLASAQIVGRSMVIDNAETVALRLAPFMKALMTVLTPVTALLHRAGVRLSGEDRAESDESIFMSEDGLRLLMQVNEEEGDIQESEKEMIASILEMDETVAREVMVPRIDMVTLPVESSLHEALNLIIEAGHSRIPVFEGNVDVIVGMLYAKDLLPCFRDNRTDMPIREILRPVYYVPASKKVNVLFKEMQQQRMHLAMVVDEYGGIAGLVSVEDIIEEIVGEIQDEYDVDEEMQYQPIGEHAYLLNSRLDVDSLAKLLDLDLAEEESDTLGGLIYSRLGHVPEQGETVDIDGWRFCVLSLDGRRINQVRADRIIQSTSGDETTKDPPRGHRSKSR